MSKVGQAVFEGQEFAQQHYNIPSSQFKSLAEDTFGKSTIQYDSAVEEFETIGQDLTEFFSSEPYVPAKIDKDGIPY